MKIGIGRLVGAIFQLVGKAQYRLRHTFYKGIDMMARTVGGKATQSTTVVMELIAGILPVSTIF